MKKRNLYHTTDKKVLEELGRIVTRLRTVGQLEEFARTHSSPVVSELLLGAIAFFSENTGMGLRFKLKSEHPLTPSTAAAFSTWIVTPQNGGSIGINLKDAELSREQPLCGNPRAYVLDLLKMIVHRKV